MNFSILMVQIIILKDLFVSERFRKRGIAKSLVVEVAKIARNTGACRINWYVLSRNKQAVEFYRKVD